MKESEISEIRNEDFEVIFENPDDTQEIVRLFNEIQKDVELNNFTMFTRAEQHTISSFFEQRGPEDIERFVSKNLDITERVFACLKERNWTQKDLAEAMGKSEAEVSKWLSGGHNLTLRSIAKIEAAIGKKVIL